MLRGRGTRDRQTGSRAGGIPDERRAGVEASSCHVGTDMGEAGPQRHTSGFTLSYTAQETGKMGERNSPRWHSQPGEWGLSQSALQPGASLASILTPDQRVNPGPSPPPLVIG